MKIIECDQGSPEWHAARLGKVGASSVSAATAKTKSGWGASRANLASRLVIERLTGKPTETFVNDAMRWGTEQEPDARRLYAMMQGVNVQTIGLVLHPTLEWSHASPDGLVGDDGLVEIKCPNSATHIETLLGAPVDGGYVKQMHWQMICTGRRWCDFVSYDPRMPAEMQIHVQRVERNDVLCAELTEQITVFLTEVAGTVAELRKMYGMEQAA